MVLMGSFGGYACGSLRGFDGKDILLMKFVWFSKSRKPMTAFSLSVLGISTLETFLSTWAPTQSTLHFIPLYTSAGTKTRGSATSVPLAATDP